MYKFDLTIITATYNVVKAGRVEMLERCVKSVAALKTPHEHIIIDGASEDGTVDVLKRLVSECDGVRFISEPDKGLYDALNKGIMQAHGKWLYVIGSDDYICDPGVFDEAVSFAEARDAHVVAFPENAMVNGQPVVKVVCPRNLFWGMPYHHQSVIMRSDMVKTLGGFSLKYKISSDHDLILRAHLEYGAQLAIFDRACTFFNDIGVSSSGQGRLESAESTGDRLGLDPRQKEILFRKRIIPFCKACRLVLHSCAVVRCAAVYTIGRIIVDCLGGIDADGLPRGSFLKRVWKPFSAAPRQKKTK